MNPTILPQQRRQRASQSQVNNMSFESSLLYNHQQHINPEAQTQNQSIKGCSCKKSKCAKLYCECYFSGLKCSQNCKCLNCQNIISEGSNSSRVDPNDQAESIKKFKNSGRGCNCKKSECSKKYCQCFNAGMLCSNLCKCEQCKNLVSSESSQYPQQHLSSIVPKAIFHETNLMEQKTKHVNERLDILLTSVEKDHKQSMLEFIYYLLS